MPEPRMTAVLIHGAWAGGWVWDIITPLLEASGFTVLAPDLPGCGERLGMPEEASLQQCVKDLERRLENVDGPLLLVGHSGGGAVATQLAEAIHERVVGVAYLAGMMLPSGTGFGEVVTEMMDEHPAASGIGPYLQWDAGRQVSQVPAHAIRDIFLQDVSKSVAEQAIPRFGPQAEGSRVLVPLDPRALRQTAKALCGGAPGPLGDPPGTASNAGPGVRGTGGVSGYRSCAAGGGSRGRGRSPRSVCRPLTMTTNYCSMSEKGIIYTHGEVWGAYSAKISQTLPEAGG